jgi:hypothetical protein
MDDFDDISCEDYFMDETYTLVYNTSSEVTNA